MSISYGTFQYPYAVHVTHICWSYLDINLMRNFYNDNGSCHRIGMFDQEFKQRSFSYLMVNLILLMKWNLRGLKRQSTTPQIMFEGFKQ
jgi:hypothetical protein